jgi:putative salt-induced outer membrane protein YdiY
MAIRFHLHQAAVFAAVSLAVGNALAQPTVKADGQWRATIGVAASYSSGNTDSSSISLKADAVRATSSDKITAYGRALYGETDGKTNAELLGLGGRYNFNLSARTYVFGQADYLRDKPANVQFRFSAAGGLGYKLVDTEAHKFDVLAGAGYTHDRFFSPKIVADELRSRYGHAELLFGEESSHRLTETTTFRQKLVVYPNLRESGDYRAEFDAGIAVAINRTMNLTAGLNYRYNSDPGVGLKKGDVLFLTGLSVKFD